MIINSVMLKLKNSDPASIAQVKEKLLGLKGTIDALVDIQVETNLRPGGKFSYDIIFFTKFNSPADMDAYITHPVHMEAGKFIMNLVEAQSSVCYEAS